MYHTRFIPIHHIWENIYIFMYVCMYVCMAELDGRARPSLSGSAGGAATAAAADITPATNTPTAGIAPTTPLLPPATY